MERRGEKVCFVRIKNIRRKKLYVWKWEVKTKTENKSFEFKQNRKYLNKNID